MVVKRSDATPREAVDATSPGRVSPKQRHLRQRAVNFARASLELEGFIVGHETELNAIRFVDGEIGLEEFVALGLVALSSQ